MIHAEWIIQKLKYIGDLKMLSEKMSKLVFEVIDSSFMCGDHRDDSEEAMFNHYGLSYVETVDKFNEAKNALSEAIQELENE